MKNNLFNKKLIILFIVMITMISLVFYFLSKSSSVQSDIFQKTGLGNNIDLLEKKRNNISKIFDSIDKSFDSSIEEFLNGLTSYVELPLEAERVGNEYPFGNPVETKANESLINERISN